MGVLPSQKIRALCRTGIISGIDERYINPGSLDLPVAEEAYRLEKIFVPQEGEKIRDILSWAGATRHNLANALEVDVPYLVRLEGTLELPPHIYAHGNPKSTSGRLNVFVRIVADGVDKYDMIERGWRGGLWMFVQPRSFPVLLSPGIALGQIRFFDKKSFLDQTDTELADREFGFFFDRSGTKLPLTGKRSDADALYLSLRADSGQVGWYCSGSNRILDLAKIGHYRPEELSFKPMLAHEGEIVLRRGVFYVLTTEEAVKVPPNCSAELRATEPRLGEFRAHFAGFIDAGWGYGTDPERHGQPITLEVTTIEKQLSLRHQQTIARIRFEQMGEVPDVLYSNAKSNYVGQADARLSKHFVLD